MFDNTIAAGKLLEQICKRQAGRDGIPEVMIIAAHPDDETLGAGGILKYLRDTVSIVTVTDGSPKNLHDALACGFSSREAYTAVRFLEQKQALNLIEIDYRRCYQIGFTDQEVSYNLPGLSCKLLDVIRKVKPTCILTHAFEGGHPDHDGVAFAVWAACQLLIKEGEIPPIIIEFSSYHGDGNSDRFCFGFIPVHNRTIWKVNLTGDEYICKQQMLGCFQSQHETVSMFPVNEEAFRLVPDYDFCCAPHRGVLLYEFYDWGMSLREWLSLSKSTIDLLGLGEK